MDEATIKQILTVVAELGDLSNGRIVAEASKNQGGQPKELLRYFSRGEVLAEAVCFRLTGKPWIGGLRDEEPED